MSNQYLSDVKRGRRRVSDKLLVRIVGENPFLAEPGAEPCSAEASGLNAFPAEPIRAHATKSKKGSKKGESARQ